MTSSISSQSSVNPLSLSADDVQRPANNNRPEVSPSATFTSPIAKLNDLREIQLQASEPITVERIYGSPSINGPTPRLMKFSPDGTRVTFLKAKEEDHKQYDLWEYNIAERQTRMLVDSKSLSAQEKLSEEEKAHRERMRLFVNGIADYQWAKDGKSLLFPLSGKVYLYELSDSPTSKELPLNNSGYPIDIKLSPKSSYVSFIDKGNLTVHKIASEETSRLTLDGSDVVHNGAADFLAQEEMDRYTGYWWSSNEKRIAFIRVDETPVEVAQRCEIHADEVKVYDQRYPKAGTNNPTYRIGVVKPETGKTRWMQLDQYEGWYVARLQWLPDNKHIAVQMIDRDQQKLDLLFINTKTKKVERILQETSKTWINLHHDLHFLKNGFLWASERTGYKHLYRYDMQGNLINQITDGNWVMDKVVDVNEEKGVVLFQGFRDTPKEYHLYSVSLTKEKGKVEKITKREGWHTIVMSPEGNTYIDTFSNTSTPPQVSLHDEDGHHLHFLEENRLDKTHPYYPFLANHSIPEFGTIKAVDGQDLHYSMIKPTFFDESQKYPVIVTVYGGPSIHSVKNAWCSGHGGMWTQVMADKGYIIFTLDNRGAYNYGKKFEDPIYKKTGVVEVQDQKTGVEFLKTLPYVDGENIGVFGWSYGGYMTLMMLFKEPEIFKTGVAIAPVTEWELYDTFYTERYMSLPQKNMEGYKESAVFPYVHNKIGNLLLVHGMADDNVLYTNTVKLVKQMQTKGVKFEMMDYPGSKHSISEPESRVHLFNMTTDFFERVMKC